MTNSRVEAEYRARTRRSADLYAEACKVLPAGLTHDSRTLLPYPDLCRPCRRPAQVGRRRQRVRRLLRRPRRAAAGPWPPRRASRRSQAQLALGTHWGASHELEVRWAELVNRADPVRREGALHRLRHRGLAPGAPARPRLHRQGQDDPLRRPLPRLARRRGGRRHVALRRRRAGRAFPPASSIRRSCCRPTTSARVAETLAARDDVAAVMLEPSGASWGQVPLPPGFLADAARRHARARRDADLRRGDHRLSLVARRRAGGATGSRPTSASSPRSSPAACPAARSPAGADI